MNKGKASKEIGKIILLTLAISGIVILAASSPGFGYILKEIEKRKFKKYKNYRLNQSLKRLEKQRLVEINEENGETIITLTEKGQQKVLSFNLETMQLKKGKWDEIWRIIIFDIPEEKKAARNFLRQKMKELGFYTLQKSVLVTPWPCQREIDFIRHFYDVTDNVKLIESNRFDNDYEVKRYFNL